METGTSGSRPVLRKRRSIIRTSAAAIALATALLAGGAYGRVLTDQPQTVTPQSSRAAVTAPAQLGGGLVSAISSLQGRLRRSPEDWRSWALLGLAYVQEARVSADPRYYPKAEGTLERSLHLRPNANFEAGVGYAALSSARHRFATALSWGQRARTIDPYNENAYGVIGDAQLELGRYQAAFSTLQRMVDLKPNAASYARASYARELMGDVGGAIAAMKLSLDAASAPEDRAFASYQLGELFWNQGRLEEARRWYHSSRSYGIAYSAPVAGLAKVAWAEGRPERAAKLYRRAIQRTPLPEYAAALGDLFSRDGRPALAARQYALVRVEERLFQAAGVNVDLELALFDADHGRPRAALASAQTEWGRRRSVHVADALGWALYRNGRYSEASRYAALALRLGYRNALFHFHAGMIDLALHRVAAARDELQTAMRVNPHFSILHSRTAERTLRRLEGAP
jgi:tetratricopeptide (TPR) repeat protein